MIDISVFAGEDAGAMELYAVSQAPSWLLVLFL
jgi:hypothetical protein